MTPSPNAVRVTKITEASAVNEQTKLIDNVIRVEFTVGTHGPFVETFRKAEWNPANALQKLQAFAAGLLLLQK